MKLLKKKIAIAVTVALLAFPLSTALAMADTVPTTPQVTTTETTVPATTELQAEAAVAAYEAAPITTLAEVTTAEGLKEAADTAVAAVVDVDTKAALALRVTNRAVAIVTAKTVLQAEAAVAAYEAAPLTTLAEVTTAEGLKAAADAAVTAVVDAAAKTALELRVTNQTTKIATAKTTLTPVVDGNGNTVKSSTWFTDLIRKLQLALTFDPVRKAELNERHALAKLAEANKLINDGNTEAAQICLNQYTDKITKAQAFLDQVKDPTSEAHKTLATALDNVNSNNVVVLGNLIDKLPPQAAQKLALNVVRSMERVVTKMQKEDAKVAPVVTPATPPVIDSKTLEKQAKVALENFKKSLNHKGKIHIEDQEDNGDKNSQSPETQSITQSNLTDVTVVPVKPQTAPTVIRKSVNRKEDQSTRTENGKNKGGNKEDNQRGN